MGEVGSQLSIWTDGSCEPNPGVGGWAALLDFKGTRKLIYGREMEETTNNRMELQAAIEGLNAVKRGFKGEIVVISDSQYLVNTMNGQWRAKTNLDLFNQLSRLQELFTVRWQWVKGHSGIVENEIVNTKANAEAMHAFHEPNRP